MLLSSIVSKKSIFEFVLRIRRVLNLNMILNWNLFGIQFFQNAEKIINKIRLYKPEILVLQNFSDKIIQNYITTDYNYHNYENKLLIATKHKILTQHINKKRNLIITMIDHPYYGKLNIGNTALTPNYSLNQNSLINRHEYLNYILKNYNFNLLCGTLYEDFNVIKKIASKYKMNETKIITCPYTYNQEDYILVNMNKFDFYITSDTNCLSPHRLLNLNLSKWS